MPFQHFDHYSADELALAGEAFKLHFSGFSAAETGTWTQAMLAWFADTHRPGLKPYYNGCDGEFMLDQCHMDFPAEVGDWHERYETAVKTGRCRMYLALESEMGRRGDPKLSKTLILEDAAKIACVRAHTKVMIFASEAGQNRVDLFKSLIGLRQAAGDDSPWLCIDVPWGIQIAGIAWIVVGQGGSVVAQSKPEPLLPA